MQEPGRQKKAALEIEKTANQRSTAFQISWVKTQFHQWGRDMPFSFSGNISLQMFWVPASLHKCHIPVPHLFHICTSFVTWRICSASRFSLLPLPSQEGGWHFLCMLQTSSPSLRTCYIFHLIVQWSKEFPFGQSMLLWVPWTSLFSKATSCSLFLLFFWDFSITHLQLLQTTGCKGSHIFLLRQFFSPFKIEDC